MKPSRPFASLPALLGCLLLYVSVSAAEQPADFKWRIPVQADGGQALYQVDLPSAVYRGAFRRDAGDLRVFNGAGEVVPHAFRPRLASTVEARAPISLQPFALRGDAGTGLNGLHVRVEQSAGKTIFLMDSTKAPSAQQQLLGYLLDLSSITEPLQALVLEVASASGYAGKVKVEASPDLAHWRTLVAEAPLVRLEQSGTLLERRRIELPPGKNRYLRLSWSAMPADAALTGAQAEPGDQHVDVERQWTRTAGTALHGKPGEYAFDVQGHFPADRLRLVLPQPNTVAQVELLSRNSSQDAWRSVARSTAYRLRRGDGEITSADISVPANADRYWLLRVDQKGGGLGAGQPMLALGWLPERLVFAARGAAPFVLTFGNRSAAPSAYPIETLVPGYRRDADLGAARAAVADLLPAEVKPAGPEAEAVMAPPTEPVDWKKWTLWAVLVLGVAALGWMAWRLLRQMDAK